MPCRRPRRACSRSIAPRVRSPPRQLPGDRAPPYVCSLQEAQVTRLQSPVSSCLVAAWTPRKRSALHALKCLRVDESAKVMRAMPRQCCWRWCCSTFSEGPWPGCGMMRDYRGRDGMGR